MRSAPSQVSRMRRGLAQNRLVRNGHGAIPLQQAIQGAPAQGQARGQGGSQARAAREGGGGGRRRYRLESGGRRHPPSGHRPERSERGGVRAGRRGGAGRFRSLSRCAASPPSSPLSAAESSVRSWSVAVRGRRRAEDLRAGVNGRPQAERSTGGAKGARPSTSADGHAPRTQDPRASAPGTRLASQLAQGGRDMHLRYALLALLGEGEAHGYELLKRFNRRIGPFWHPNIGQVYQLLHELERRGRVVRRDAGADSRARRGLLLAPPGERWLGTVLTLAAPVPAPPADRIFVRPPAAGPRDREKGVW